MRSMGFAGVIRGKRVRTTIADKAAPCPRDHVNRQLDLPRFCGEVGRGLGQGIRSGGIFWFGLDHLSVPACTLRWPPSGAAVKDGRQAVGAILGRCFSGPSS
jgi:hypothetical protein